MSSIEANINLLADGEILPEQSQVNGAESFSGLDNTCLQNPISPAAPCVKPMEDLYGDIPDLSLSSGLEMTLEQTGFGGWALDEDRLSINKPQECEPINKRGQRVGGRSLGVSRGSYACNAQLLPPQKFSIRNHLKSLHFSKVN